MSIVGGLDIHRNQLTFDWADKDSGRWERGRIAPADREHLARWLTQFDAGARHLRELLDVGMLPECYIPPDRVLEWRATLELYSDLRIEHSGWVQRIHAVCFHQGITAVGPAGVVRGSRERLARIVADQLSPVGRLQVNTALAVMDALDEHLARLRRRIVATAEHVAGAQALRQAIYGVGPMTALALLSWLGPEVLRWLLFEAAKTSARSFAPVHDYHTTVRQRHDGNRAALSQARRIVRHAVHILTDLGDDAFTATPAVTSTAAR